MTITSPTFSFQLFSSLLNCIKEPTVEIIHLTERVFNLSVFMQVEPCAAAVFTLIQQRLIQTCAVLEKSITTSCCYDFYIKVTKVPIQTYKLPSYNQSSARSLLCRNVKFPTHLGTEQQLGFILNIHTKTYGPMYLCNSYA